MHLTDSTDYTLRVLIHLNRTKSVTTLTELSKKLKISRNTLTKISNRLAKSGYVETTRGPSGGLLIRKETGEISLGEIISNTEENLYLAECFAGSKISCTLLKGCVLKVCLNEALDAFVSTLNKYTLNDISLPGKAS